MLVLIKFTVNVDNSHICGNKGKEKIKRDFYRDFSGYKVAIIVKNGIKYIVKILLFLLLL